MKRTEMPAAGEILPGRPEPLPVNNRHYVSGNPIKPPFPPACRQALFGMGCFWGGEKTFWQLPGVYTTAVGYAGGGTPNPTYAEVCSGYTGHNEVVLVVFDPARITYRSLLRIFWESHDPTQGMRQGYDVGTQYRSGIYTFDEQQYEEAGNSLHVYARCLAEAGFPEPTTEILRAPEFYYAEDYHQQYLAKNPAGYCGLGGTGVSCGLQ